eukprot:gene20155-27608_t
MALEFTDASFKTDVLGSDKLTVVDFWAEWCGPCRMVGPLVEEMSKEYEGKAIIGKLDVDSNPNVVKWLIVKLVQYLKTFCQLSWMPNWHNP